MSNETGPSAKDFPASKIAFEEHYGDGSGVQYAVRYDGNAEGRELEFESVDTVVFPIDRLDWLLNALQRIADEGA